MNTIQNVLCPLCDKVADHKLTMPIDAKTFKSISHGHVYECKNCHFGFIHPRPSEEETKKFYDLDAYYTQGQSHMANVGSSTLLSRLRVHLAWRLDRGKSIINIISSTLPINGSVVDIGCGAGSLLRGLYGYGYQVTGVERDPNSTSRNNLDIEVLAGSAERLPEALQQNNFDGVVFAHVIEHLTDPILALQNAAKLLKPGGLMYLTVPNCESLIASKSGLAWEHLDIPRHINFFSESSLKKLVTKAGLKWQRSYFDGYCRYFDDSYIKTEQNIYDKLVENDSSLDGSTRNDSLEAWKLLLNTLFASAKRKYDSVGVVAIK